MSKAYDIAIAWRIYPKVSKVPIIFADDKYRMVETSLRSFIESARGLKIFYFFLLDGCPPEYNRLIASLFDPQVFSIVETPAIGNGATFAKQIEILSEQDKADIIYFAEDDYLYAPGEFKKAYDLLRNDSSVDFISCYLPMDVFRHPIHQHKRLVAYKEDKCWLTANSTCLTFMTSVKTLNETKPLLLTYAKGNNDCAIWLIITKTHVLNPLAYIKFMGNKECFGILKMAVKYSFRYFFSLRKYRLWMPHTAICTHLEKGNESPGVDWVSISNRINDA